MDFKIKNKPIPETFIPHSPQPRLSIPEQKSDTVDFGNKKKSNPILSIIGNTITIIGSAAGLVGAIVKRKEIGKFFQKLFNKKTVNEIPKIKKPQAPQQPPAATVKPVAVIPPKAPLIERPAIDEAAKPKEFAKQYVKNAMAVIGYSEEDTIEGLGIIKKYATNIEQLDEVTYSLTGSIATHSGKSSVEFNNRIMNEFLDIYEKLVKEPDQWYPKMMAYLVHCNHDIMTKDTINRFIKAYEKTACHKADTGCLKYFQENLTYNKNLTDADRSEIHDSAQKVIDVILDRYAKHEGKFRGKPLDEVTVYRREYDLRHGFGKGSQNKKGET